MFSGLKRVISISSGLILRRVAIANLLVENLTKVLVAGLVMALEGKGFIVYKYNLMLIRVKLNDIIVLLLVSVDICK